jgi:hypothetical protein
MADWKTLWERYAELPIETRIKLMQAFRSKSEDELRDLFKREPFAAMLFGKLRDDEVRGLLGPRKPVPMPAPPPLPKPVVPEVKKETVEVLVDREIRSYSLVHPETEEFLKVHRNEVLAEALRRVPARVKRDFEEARAKGISYIEDDAFRSASHEALLVVSEYGEKAKVAVPPKPAELPTEEIERLKTIVRNKVFDLGFVWSPEVWDRFWREYEHRARELWMSKRVSHLPEELEDVLRAVVPPKPPTPVPPRPLTKDEIQRLQDLWSDAFFRELGRVPPNAMATFRVELEKVKDKPFLEAQEYLLGVARDLIADFVARRAIERVEVPRRAVEPYRPPEEEEFVAIGRVPPTEPPKEPLEPPEMKFPRGPSRREELVLWDAFRYRLQEQGYNPFDYQDEFQEYIANTQFRDWKDLLERFEFFVKSIKEGKALPPLWQWKGMPIPVGLEGVLRKTPAERLQDVIVHFSSVVIRNARSIGKEATLEDLRKELEERALIPPDMIITPASPLYTEIRNALMAAYKRKDPWLANITLEELDKFLLT